MIPHSMLKLFRPPLVGEAGVSSGDINPVPLSESILEPLKQYMSKLKEAGSPEEKYVYIDLITDLLFDIARHFRNPIAFTAFMAIGRQVVDIKELLKQPVNALSLINKVIEYYSAVVEALEQEDEGRAMSILFKAIKDKALPLFLELRAYRSLSAEEE